MDFSPDDDPLKPWVRRASWDRQVAYTATDACGVKAEPWHTIPCDFTKGHNTLDTSNGKELLNGGHNSTTDQPWHLSAVTRFKRHEDGTSPLT